MPGIKQRILPPGRSRDGGSEALPLLREMEREEEEERERGERGERERGRERESSATRLGEISATRHVTPPPRHGRAPAGAARLQLQGTYRPPVEGYIWGLKWR